MNKYFLKYGYKYTYKHLTKNTELWETIAAIRKLFIHHLFIYKLDKLISKFKLGLGNNKLMQQLHKLK